jgi:hypothetical protein
MEDFMSVPLWFEDGKEEDLLDILNPTKPTKFNRPAKLKRALYCNLKERNKTCTLA